MDSSVEVILVRCFPRCHVLQSVTFHPGSNLSRIKCSAFVKRWLRSKFLRIEENAFVYPRWSDQQAALMADRSWFGQSVTDSVGGIGDEN
jgi:hypothetical protein